MCGNGLHFFPQMWICAWMQKCLEQLPETAEAMKYSLAVHFSLLAEALSDSHKYPQIDQECKV